MNCIRFLSIYCLMVFSTFLYAKNNELSNKANNKVMGSEIKKQEDNQSGAILKNIPESKIIKNPVWSGSIEYGIIATSGNTNTRSETGKASMLYKKKFWDSLSSWYFLKASDSGITSADQTIVRNYTKFTIENNNFIFLSFNYERDSFSGFLSRTTEVVGYGLSVIKKNNFHWDIELGAGETQTKRTDGIDQNNVITRIGTNLSWHINKNSQLSEILFMEKGENNTFVESLSSIKVKINDSLSLNLSLKVKNNSIVPENIKHTDTQTTVNIVYDF